MGAYILRRLLLMIPTLFGIMLVSFVVVQFAPGGPVEQAIAQMSGTAISSTARVTGTAEGDFAGVDTVRPNVDAEPTSQYRGARGLRPEYIAALEKQFGFDKPPLERFFMMLWNYLRFDFGNSYFQRQVGDRPRPREDAGLDHARALDDAPHLRHLDPARHRQGGARRLALRRLDLGRHHRRLRAARGSSFAILLIVLFAGGSFWNIFPLRGLDLGELGHRCPGGSRSSIISGTSRCRSSRWRSAPSRRRRSSPRTRSSTRSGSNTWSPRAPRA